MNGIAQIVGCLLMYGIGKNSALSLAPWRVLFIICGALTSAAGVVFFIFMPNGPKDAWFLDERQKHVLSLRMVKDREGGDKTSFSTSQLKEALLDVKTWFVFAFGVLVTMQSPVLTVRAALVGCPIERNEWLTACASSRPWSSKTSAIPSSRQCCMGHHLVQCKSPCSGSVSWDAFSFLGTEHWSHRFSSSHRWSGVFAYSNYRSVLGGA